MTPDDKESNLGREALNRGELDLPSTESDRVLIRSDLDYTEEEGCAVEAAEVAVWRREGD
jgi:hypothetical protein